MGLADLLADADVLLADEHASVVDALNRMSRAGNGSTRCKRGGASNCKKKHLELGAGEC